MICGVMCEQSAGALGEVGVADALSVPDARLAHLPGSNCCNLRSDATPYGDVMTTLVQEPFFQVTNTRLGKGSDSACTCIDSICILFNLIGPLNCHSALRYEWDKNMFPWLCLWTEHRCV